MRNYRRCYYALCELNVRSSCVFFAFNLSWCCCWCWSRTAASTQGVGREWELSVFVQRINGQLWTRGHESLAEFSWGEKLKKIIMLITNNQTVMMTAQSRQIKQTRRQLRERERESGSVQSKGIATKWVPRYAASASASRPNSKLNVCTFYSPLISSSLVLSLSRPDLVSLSPCLLPSAGRLGFLLPSHRCDRMKYCPEGRYNFDAFTTFRVLVIIGSLCLEVSFMIAFLFS